MLIVSDKPATNHYKPNHGPGGWFRVSIPFVDGRNISSSSSRQRGRKPSLSVIFHLFLSLRHRKLLVLNSIYFNLTKKHMASAALLLLLMHSCYKERPLNRRFVEYYATWFIPFQAKLFYFKCHSSAKGFQCKSFSGGFSPTHHLSPQEKGAQGGEPGLWLLQPDSAAGEEGTWTWDRFSPEATWLLLLRPSHFLGDGSAPVSLPNGTLTMFKAKKNPPLLNKFMLLLRENKQILSLFSFFSCP